MRDTRPEAAARPLAFYQAVSGWLASERVRMFTAKMPVLAGNNSPCSA